MAIEILKKYTTKPNLIKHAIAVSAAMSHFARIAGENEEYWATVGMLHDIDYECCSQGGHCHECVAILRDEGFDEAFIRAVRSHGHELACDVEPILHMEKILCIVDQLTGFIIACAMIRPEKKLAMVELASMQKRWKSPSFAAGTGRERIEKWCARIGVTLDYMFVETHKALLAVADELGLS